MSHAQKADKLLIKPAAGADRRRRTGQINPKARTKRPVTRRVTHGTAHTRLATAADRPMRRVLPSPEPATHYPRARHHQGATHEDGRLREGRTCAVSFPVR